MNTSVLVLNANFEPINVCNVRRAIGLILAEKAALVLNGRGEIKTVSSSYPIPSIIRLEKMVVHPRPHVRLTRKEIFHRDNYTCQYCGHHTGDLTIDHVLPRRLGGRHVWTNVVAACPRCNHRKGGRTAEEASMHLLHLPKEPPSSILYVFGRHLSENNEWEPFIIGW
jgi:5-methylcytosine-specific restriction endonuclease McrA